MGGPNTIIPTVFGCIHNCGVPNFLIQLPPLDACHRLTCYPTLAQVRRPIWPTQKHSRHKKFSQSMDGNQTCLALWGRCTSAAEDMAARSDEPALVQAILRKDVKVVLD